MRSFLWGVVVSLVIVAGAQGADVMTFEGLADGEAIQQYYNGGLGGAGSGPGPSYGVTWSNQAFVGIDVDAGGSANTAFEPSGETTMGWILGQPIMNASGGFTIFSAYFSALDTGGSVNFYSGSNATGSLLGTISLWQNAPVGGGGDPNGAMNYWDQVGWTSSGGMAYSARFSGPVNQIAFDDVSVDIPEPTTGSFLALGGLALMRRRRA